VEYLSCIQPIVDTNPAPIRVRQRRNDVLSDRKRTVLLRVVRCETGYVGTLAHIQAVVNGELPLGLLIARPKCTCDTPRIMRDIFASFSGRQLVTARADQMISLFAQQNLLSQ
jgi:hypothetical protein